MVKAKARYEPPAKKTDPLLDRTFFVWLLAKSGYFLLGGKSVQLPCATSAAMPMLSPSVGCG